MEMEKEQNMVKERESSWGDGSWRDKMGLRAKYRSQIDGSSQDGKIACDGARERERVLTEMNSEGIKKNFRERSIGLREKEREQDSVREREREREFSEINIGEIKMSLREGKMSHREREREQKMVSL